MQDRLAFADRIATAPISWGVCEVPGWGHQLSPDRVLGEMAALGFTKTELGSAGWLPPHPDQLRSLLDRHGLGLLASFVPLVLHDVATADAALAQATETAQLLTGLGARYFNTAPVTTVDWAPRRTYTEDEWQHLYEQLGRIDEICASHDLVQVVHEHIGCVVETEDDVRRVLDNTAVKLVLDTGHLAVGGFDPLDIANDFADRVGLVHLKDTRFDVAERLNANELSLMEAVQAGLFPALGEGQLPIGDIIATLEAKGFDGHYVIEQDCAITGDIPSPGDGPVRDVAISVAYLQQVGSTLSDGLAPSGGGNAPPAWS